MRNKRGNNYEFTSVILSAKFMSCFSASEGFASRPPPGLRPRTPAGGLPSSRPP